MKQLGNCLLICLGIVLTYSAVQHLDNPWRFLVVLRKYDLVDGAIASLSAACLPVVQLSIGLLLISLRQPRAASLAAVILFLTFSIAQTSVLLKRLDVSCGCFPAFESSVSTLTAARAYALTLLAAAAYFIFWRLSLRTIRT